MKLRVKMPRRKTLLLAGGGVVVAGGLFWWWRRSQVPKVYNPTVAFNEIKKAGTVAVGTGAGQAKTAGIGQIRAAMLTRAQMIPATEKGALRGAMGDYVVRR